jgi:hypothetical protein
MTPYEDGDGGGLLHFRAQKPAGGGGSSPSPPLLKAAELAPQQDENAGARPASKRRRGGAPLRQRGLNAPARSAAWAVKPAACSTPSAATLQAAPARDAVRARASAAPPRRLTPACRARGAPSRRDTLPRGRAARDGPAPALTLRHGTRAARLPDTDAPTARCAQPATAATVERRKTPSRGGGGGSCHLCRRSAGKRFGVAGILESARCSAVRRGGTRHFFHQGCLAMQYPAQLVRGVARAQRDVTAHAGSLCAASVLFRHQFVDNVAATAQASGACPACEELCCGESVASPTCSAGKRSAAQAAKVAAEVAAGTRKAPRRRRERTTPPASTPAARRPAAPRAAKRAAAADASATAGAARAFGKLVRWHPQLSRALRLRALRLRALTHHFPRTRSCSRCACPPCRCRPTAPTTPRRPRRRRRCPRRRAARRAARARRA